MISCCFQIEPRDGFGEPRQLLARMLLTDKLLNSQRKVKYRTCGVGTLDSGKIIAVSILAHKTMYGFSWNIARSLPL